MESQNLSPITCRNSWSYSRDAFSPFCSKFKTCCFSDSAGNCYSWSKVVSHRLWPQPLLPFSFPTAETQWIPQSTPRDRPSAKSSPGGSWWGRSLQHVAHPALVSLQERKGKISPLGAAWGNPADFEVPMESHSAPLVPTSKDKCSSGGVSLRAFSSTSPALTPQASSCFPLGGYWFGHRMKSNLTFQICQGESLCPRELWNKEAEKGH